jgi:hypothetical protein
MLLKLAWPARALANLAHREKLARTNLRFTRRIAARLALTKVETPAGRGGQPRQGIHPES